MMAIITGNRAKEMFAGESLRYAAYDGGLTDLDSTAPATLIPGSAAIGLIRSAGAERARWRSPKRSKLKEIVRKAHEKAAASDSGARRTSAALWRELLAKKLI